MNRQAKIYCSLALLTAAPLASAQSYGGKLHAVNPDATPGSVSGRVELVREGDQLQVRVDGAGLAPGMMHLQHLHGSRDGMQARCAPAQGDRNGDGYVDLIETRRYSGVTLIPLHEQPVSLQIKSDSYPRAGGDGSFSYRQSINWPQLQQAVAEQYGLQAPDLGRMVVYVHGIPGDRPLPDSVRSLPGVPAQVTLPVACAELSAG